jgi:stage V sporulation protein T
MRATGILRRIDDLGRIVIPKEIRRSMRIREGDALEIFTEKDMICFKKYNLNEDFLEEIKSLENDILNEYYITGNAQEINIIKMAFQEIRHQLKAIEDKREEE